MILDDVFYLLDIDETPLRALPLTAEYKLEDLQDSTNQLELRLPFRAAGRIVTDQEIFFRGRRFSILRLGFDKDTQEIILTCDELQTRLADANIPTFTLKDKNLVEAMELALARVKGWTIGIVFETTLNYNAELKNVSSLFALRFLERQSGGRLYFDSGRKQVHILKVDERIADVVFQYAKNIANIVKEQTSPQATVLFPYGRDGMTIEALTGGKKYVEDFSWYTTLGMTIEDARAKYTKELVWEDDRYIYNANLHRDAITRLSLLSQPQINYKLEKASAEGVELGMMAYVYDEDLDIRVRVAVVKLIRSSNPEENEIELDYMPPSLGATLDNTYSGDTNTGQSGETSFFLEKNKSEVIISNTVAPIITTDVTVFSATAFEMGLVLSLNVTAGGLLEGYFLLDGERLPTDLKQTVAPGWYTFGLPFIVTGVQEGLKTLHFYLTISGTGRATLPKEKAEFFVKATGVYGGASNDKPDQTLTEEVKLLRKQLTATDNAFLLLDLPRHFAAVETVQLQQETIQGITEARNIFLDPPPVGSPPPAPLSDTQIREEFADMWNYQQPTRPTQSQANDFIDIIHAEANHFAILASEYVVYLIASYGSYLDISFPTPGNPIITADDDLYISYGTNNVFRGQSIDWSVNNPNAFTVTERYSVPEPLEPGEAGPPRRIQYETNYSMTATAIEYTPGQNDRLSLTPVEEGIIYRITRGTIPEIFALGFVTAAPQFNETNETLVVGFEMQDPAALETEITAPDGATHLIVYERNLELSEVVIQALEKVPPAELPELFAGDYTAGYFPGSTSTLTYQPKSPDVIGGIVPVVPGEFYRIDKGLASTSRFRIQFQSRYPNLSANTSDTSIGLAYEDLTSSNLQTVVRQAPAGAAYLFLYVSNTGQKTPISVKQLTGERLAYGRRETYAGMTSTIPDQSFIDKFLENDYPQAKFLAMITDETFLYVFVALGTYFDIGLDPTTGRGVLKSDGDILSMTNRGNVIHRGTLLDWTDANPKTVRATLER